MSWNDELITELGAILQVVRKTGNLGITCEYVAYETRTKRNRAAVLLRALEDDGHVRCVGGHWYALAPNRKPLRETARRVRARNSLMSA